jgi:hypothetical protein
LLRAEGPHTRLKLAFKLGFEFEERKSTKEKKCGCIAYHIEECGHELESPEAATPVYCLIDTDSVHLKRCWLIIIIIIIGVLQ